MRKAILLIFLTILVNGGGEDLKARAAENEITFPVRLFADGKARHFEYKVPAKTGKNLTIRYFILKSSDGVIRAAFDACDVCWPEGKGYYQKGDFMICRNCGRRFASIKVNEIQGGCNPAPLKREIKGDKVVIKIEDLLIGAQYFNFREGRR
ncbi:MAG: Fe-S-containing protein [Thermodesulfobacteriota bacterium]